MRLVTAQNPRVLWGSLFIPADLKPSTTAAQIASGIAE